MGERKTSPFFAPILLSRNQQCFAPALLVQPSVGSSPWWYSWHPGVCKQGGNVLRKESGPGISCLSPHCSPTSSITNSHPLVWTGICLGDPACSWVLGWLESCLKAEPTCPPPWTGEHRAPHRAVTGNSGDILGSVFLGFHLTCPVGDVSQLMRHFQSSIPLNLTYPWYSQSPDQEC